MEPETAKTAFINGMIRGSWKCSLQLISKFLNLWRLGEGLIFKLLGMDAHSPALLLDIHAHVNGLTSKVKFVTLFHGKPPLGIYVLAD